MKRARPRNRKAAQRQARQRELEYLRRQREEDISQQEKPTEEQVSAPDINLVQSDEDIQKANDFSGVNDISIVASSSDGNNIPEFEEIPDAKEIPTEFEDYVGEGESDNSQIGDTHKDEEPSDQNSAENVDQLENIPDLIPDIPSIEGFEENKELDNIPDIADVPDDSAKGKRKPKKKRNPGKTIFKTIIWIMAIFIVLVFALLGLNLFGDTEMLAPLEEGKINVLLVGVDESGLRTDAVMVASYNVNEGQVKLLSIPRDTKIYVKNRKMTRKINEIHAISSNEEKGYILGTQATAEAVTALTGIPINYYVEFSFASIDHLFDILGPVEFDVPDVEGNGEGMNYDDPHQNLHIHLKPGIQKLSGNQVQQFLRYRKSNSGKGSGSDTDRVERQQAFIKAVIDQKVNLSTLLKLPSIFTQLSREIKTNISLNDITKYVRYFSKLSGEGITTYSLPGEAKNIGGASYFVCNIEETSLLMMNTFGIDAEIDDQVSLSEKNPQKPLKVTNVSITPEPTKEPTKAPEKDEKDDKKEEDKNQEEEATKAPAVTKEPTKAPAVTKEPTKAPAVTKEPTKAPAVTKEPLESQQDEDELEDEIMILE